MDIFPNNLKNVQQYHFSKTVLAKHAVGMRGYPQKCICRDKRSRSCLRHDQAIQFLIQAADAGIM